MKNIFLVVVLIMFLTTIFVLAEVKTVAIEKDTGNNTDIDNNTDTDTDNNTDNDTAKSLSEQIQSAVTNTENAIDTSEASTKINDEFSRSQTKLEGLAESIKEFFSGK